MKRKKAGKKYGSRKMDTEKRRGELPFKSESDWTRQNKLISGLLCQSVLRPKLSMWVCWAVAWWSRVRGSMAPRKLPVQYLHASANFGLRSKVDSGGWVVRRLEQYSERARAPPLLTQSTGTWDIILFEARLSESWLESELGSTRLLIAIDERGHVFSHRERHLRFCAPPP